MSGARTRQETSDPWWGIDEVDATNARRPPDATTRRVRVRRRRTGVGWLLLALLAAPLSFASRFVRRSPRLQRVLLRMAVVAAILAVLACSVGVILINNVVVGRTAELGELEDRRRELRRDNAVLGAQSAQLTAPGIVYRRATRDLGMVRTDRVPDFVYLYDGSRTLNARQRQRIAAAAARERAAAEATARRAATASTPEADASKPNGGDR